MWPVRAVSIFSTLMGSRLAWRRGSEGGTACTKGLVLPAGDEPGPGPELFPESALVQAGSAPPLTPPPLCLLLLRAESEGAVLMTHPRAWEQRGEGSGRCGAGSGCALARGAGAAGGGAGAAAAGAQRAFSAPGARREQSWVARSRAVAEREQPARLLKCRAACRVHLRLCPCAAHSRPDAGAGAALCAVSRCLSSRGSGVETHFKSSCTKGEIKAFAAFQSNGSPR